MQDGWLLNESGATRERLHHKESPMQLTVAAIADRGCEEVQTIWRLCVKVVKNSAAF